ncbi:MAG: CDP-diacylglycerol--glycerol-3-phosphate 3-phosphatidyltransferase [Candidatus Omnitrophota bacterium]
MNLSNKLTISRIGMAFLLMWFLFIPSLMAKMAALVLFLLACLTDFLDGWIARKRGEISDFGKIMDPVADKILVLGIFLSFVELQLIPAWMVIVVIIREVVITGMRFFAIRRGVVLAAESAGKHKTVFQMVTIFFILVFFIMCEFSGFNANYRFAILSLMFITVILTLYSGISFVWHNRALIKSP